MLVEEHKIVTKSIRKRRLGSSKSTSKSLQNTLREASGRKVPRDYFKLPIFEQFWTPRDPPGSTSGRPGALWIAPRAPEEPSGAASERLPNAVRSTMPVGRPKRSIFHRFSHPKTTRKTIEKPTWSERRFSLIFARSGTRRKLLRTPSTCQCAFDCERAKPYKTSRIVVFLPMRSFVRS